MDWRWLQSFVLIKEVERHVGKNVTEFNGKKDLNGEPINALIEDPNDDFSNKANDTFCNNVTNAPLNEEGKKTIQEIF